jgi:DNA repair exonuclease SbcCD nuclease subunit
MKIAILGDTHFGARNDLKVFHDFFQKFYDDTFIPYLVENNIKTVFQLGDLFDRRKYINFYSLDSCKRYFFDELDYHGIKLHTLVGNHDIYWRESLEVNSSSLVLGEYPSVFVHTGPGTLHIEDTAIDIIPWICADNEKEITEFISKSKSDLCIGHFEIAGFSMYRGMECHDGLSRDMFNKYEQVWSGHYHTRSKQDNITYVGTPYEMTWQDYADPKGFHVFDLETRTLEFVPNPNNIFHRIEYDDTKELPDLDIDLTGAFVKLVVVNKTDFYKFDVYLNKLYSKGCYEIKIIEDMAEFRDGTVDEEINLEDTVSVLSNYIDSVTTDMDKEKVKTYMRTLYTEAVNLEV